MQPESEMARRSLGNLLSPQRHSKKYTEGRGGKLGGALEEPSLKIATLLKSREEETIKRANSSSCDDQDSEEVFIC